VADVLLTGSGLTKRYGGVTALEDVSLRLAAGEILGLVGPNGAGKTTLVDLISGAQPATAGELMLQGRRLTGPASRRAQLGLARTFQYPQLAHDLTARENMLVGRTARRHSSVPKMIAAAFVGMVRPYTKADHDALEAIAAELGIARIDRHAGDLTLGEQRLVEVGRALTQDPLVMLLDEPFAGSDAHGVAGIIDVIRTVQRRGHGVILVDHNVDLVAGLVDRIMLLDRGRVVFDGGPKECLASPEMQRVYLGTLATATTPSQPTGSSESPSSSSPSSSSTSSSSTVEVDDARA
jgi:branched-chain amino acid transport system ATP-binding protein